MSANSNQKIKYSVLVAVYNTGSYLQQTIDSVINQTLKFRDYIEIVLVDDGSTDDSADICREYVEQFPDNIRYVYKENGGAASAFNRGIREARGKYFAMLGSDDMFSPDTIELVDVFFAEHPDLNLVSIPLYFFEAKEGPHMLNSKFDDGTREIHLTETPEHILLASGGTFIRRSAVIENNLALDPNLPIAEDATFLQHVLMLQKRYGVVAEAQYLYRKRNAGSSLLDTGSQSVKSFENVLRNAWGMLFSAYRRADGTVPEFLQYVVAYELQWRVKLVTSPLNDEQVTSYKAQMGRLLQDIEDHVIMAQKFSTIQYKVMLLKLKYGEDILANSQLEGTTYSYLSTPLFEFDENNAAAQIYILEITDGFLYIKGLFNGLRFPGLEHGFVVDGEFQPVTYLNEKLYAQTFLGEEVFDRNPFSFRVPVRPALALRPAIRLGDGIVVESMFNTYPASRLPGVNTSYKLCGNLMLVNDRKRWIRVLEATKKNVYKHEFQFMARVFLKKPYRPRSYGKLTILTHRLKDLSHYFKQNQRRVWLVSDRPDYASDNGEAFFRYAVDHVPADVDMYFLLSDKAPEYPELSKLGNVIDPRSRQARDLLLRSDAVISSQADDYVINAFAKDGHLMSGLYQFKFVFLQHGITKDDQSAWLNKFSKDIKALVTSSERERDSMVNGQYMYDPKDIVLTGMPRFDRLENCPAKKIIVAPTWRNYLRGPFDPVKKQIEYNPEFVDSEYFAFWQRLIKDPTLNDALAKNRYTAEFWLHPSHFVQVDDFEGTELFTIAHPPHNYKKGFSEGSIFVTDFSSAVFDFCYMKKPAVYTHFDIETFKTNHIYKKGYFSYEDDGFGPVCYDYESTVAAIVELVEAGAVMSQKYVERVEQFFAFTDRRNSERVMKAIQALQ